MNKCEFCGKKFTKKKHNQKFCSIICSKANQNKIASERLKNMRQIVDRFMKGISSRKAVSDATNSGYLKNLMHNQFKRKGYRYNV